MRQKECLLVSKIVGQITHYFLANHEIEVNISVKIENIDSTIIVKTPLLDEEILDAVKAKLLVERNINAEDTFLILDQAEGEKSLSLVGALMDEKKVEVTDDYIQITLIRKN